MSWSNTEIPFDRVRQSTRYKREITRKSAPLFCAPHIETFMFRDTIKQTSYQW